MRFSDFSAFIYIAFDFYLNQEWRINLPNSFNCNVANLFLDCKRLIFASASNMQNYALKHLCSGFVAFLNLLVDLYNIAWCKSNLNHRSYYSAILLVSQERCCLLVPMRQSESLSKAIQLSFDSLCLLRKQSGYSFAAALINAKNKGCG